MKPPKKTLDQMLRDARRKLARELRKRTGKEQERFLRESVDRAYADVGEKPVWAHVKRAAPRRRRHASA